jgi:hypothetical protein
MCPALPRSRQRQQSNDPDGRTGIRAAGASCLSSLRSAMGPRAQPIGPARPYCCGRRGSIRSHAKLTQFGPPVKKKVRRRAFSLAYALRFVYIFPHHPSRCRLEGVFACRLSPLRPHPPGFNPHACSTGSPTRCARGALSPACDRPTSIGPAATFTSTSSATRRTWGQPRSPPSLSP